MPNKLVIVESPAKSKTIEKFLGKDYQVLSSKGHVRDLATKGDYGFGVEIENNFKPHYVVVPGKQKVLTELKKEAKKADQVIIATDPDREGEAIGWHLIDAIELEDEKTKRVVFNEITKTAIQSAIKNPRGLDQNLVNSQEARRILDRIIGFRLSKLMQAKTAGKSAGRVQSVALKLIVDREREIEKFKPEEYWHIIAQFTDFKAELIKYKDKKVKITNENEADEILNSLKKSFTISDVKETVKKKKAKMPLTTSTFQQMASYKLGMNSKKSMMIAQKLYEGVDIGSETEGLITYMRTDSTRLANDFVKETFKKIENKYGSDYVGIARVPKSKGKIQDAHEAIRPTSINHDPEKIKSYLTPDEYKVYKLIYASAMASLMADAKLKSTSVLLDNNDYQFKANGSVLQFKGYLVVYEDYEDSKDVLLPDFANYKSKVITANEINKEQHFTKPPARYTEAKLIKEMEELGIGRPSTYTKTMETLKNRAYVEIKEKRFHPTEVGFEISDKLQQTFSNIINVKYTAKMEEDLDKIAMGEVVWHQLLQNFYDDFMPLVTEAFDNLEKKEPEKADKKCPECDHDLVYRNGKFGKFIGCSNFPKCKYIENDKANEICDCPNCDGMIVIKKSKKGREFYGCNKFPKCKTAYWDRPIGEKCPDCQKMLVEKNKKIKCSECEYQK